LTVKTLGLTRADLLDCDWDELCLVWWPEVVRLMEEAGR
jgi:hypothetical protein